MKKQIEKNLGTILICSTILITIFSYVVINLRKDNTLRQIESKNRVDKLLAETQYESCLMFAEDDYNSWWDDACEIAGKEEDCSLTTSKAKDLSNARKERKDECLEMYKIKLNN